MPITVRALALCALTGASLVAAQLGGASRHHKRAAHKRQISVDLNVGGGGKQCPFVEPGFDVARTTAQAERISTHSWEFGAAAEALLELYSPEVSVFGANPFPGGKAPVVPVSTTPGLLYVRPHILTNETRFVGADGAAGDPASLGVMAVMMGQSEQVYMDASRRQANHLLNDVPRAWNGAISHREDVAELWADFMYMAPPFLAYYAVAIGDEELLEEVVHQSEAYRQIMHANMTGPTEGLWLHIVGPQSADLVLWSTGNGWAAAGMTRIFATIKKWERCAKRAELAGRMEVLIKEILDGARGGDRLDGGLLRDKINDTTWWGEVSGTALLTATAYRMATLSPETFGNEYITWADENRFALAAHVDQDGIAKPAINPLNWFDHEKFMTGSPEGQSFMVIMYAAYRDCVCAGVCAARQPPPGWTVPPSVPPSTVTTSSSAATSTASGSATSTASNSVSSAASSLVSAVSSAIGSTSVTPSGSASGSYSAEPSPTYAAGTSLLSSSVLTEPTKSTPAVTSTNPEEDITPEATSTSVAKRADL